jgi:hypothetical protein
LGIPFANVRPSSARAIAVSNRRSIASAGRTSTKTRAGSSPADPIVRHPRRHDDDLPWTGEDPLAAHTKLHQAAHDLEALVLLGWM